MNLNFIKIIFQCDCNWSTFPLIRDVISLPLNLIFDSFWNASTCDCSGFFRVNYDSENWNRLMSSLRSEPAAVHEMSRGQLLDDSFSLARAGHLSYSVPLGLASYLTREACYFPWAAFIPHVNFLLMRLHGYPVYDVFTVSNTAQVNLSTEKKVPF